MGIRFCITLSCTHYPPSPLGVAHNKFQVSVVCGNAPQKVDFAATKQWRHLAPSWHEAPSTMVVTDGATITLYRNLIYWRRRRGRTLQTYNERNGEQAMQRGIKVNPPPNAMKCCEMLWNYSLNELVLRVGISYTAPGRSGGLFRFQILITFHFRFY